MTALLEIEDLAIAYGTARGPMQAVEGFSARVERGRTLGIVGESGSGKSTVALALMGLLPAGARVTAGSMRLAGEELTTMTPEKRRLTRGRRIGMVFQDPFLSLNPGLTVGAQVSEPLTVHRGLDAAAAMAEAARLLDSVGIGRAVEVAASYPHQLSGGMRQRAMIATALACDPEMLVLDEPTTALDVTIEAQILDLLLGLQKDRGVAMVFISHNLGVIQRVAHEVAVLYAGRVIEQGSAEAILSAPQHPYTAGLLGSLPTLDHRGHRLTPIPGGLPDPFRPMHGCNFAPRCRYREEACVAERQVLRSLAPDQLVRCRRAPLEDPAPAAPEPARARWAAADGAGPVVEIREVSKTFSRGGWAAGLFGRAPATGLRALDGVSLRIEPGEIVGLVGESGSGKSTLGRCVIRLVQPDAGEITVQGRDVLRASGGALRRTLLATQMIFQNPSSSLNPRHTVAQAIGRPVRLSGWKETPVAARVTQLLELVRLPATYAERYPHQLSGGERQRVGIARALATRPSVLLCDEAVSALDVSVQASIVNLLADLRDELGVAILFISHDLSVVAHLADRVAVLYRGRLVEEGPTEEILRAPNHPYTEALLSAAPLLRTGERIRLRGEIDTAAPIPGCCFTGRCHRRIDERCDTVPPPLRQAATDHGILCHIPVEELAAR
ncbi:dipeptide ABC transporter ATP-binding protein [Pararoseomonas indoligenes]|uniref:ABC transporter ATP-binding protein n=1 Tax=Roseomonas indoligenes TaxID=2820811 RepID=A0A940N6A9_9PROT|nr:ABC transporter ATP-binding protein [Pararoseomonas indoligenes]MBP0495905.1 ABC transporter ATP-binding protein [Pararoseomonas indoligenes]